jgi:hypothetical protein
VSELSDAHKKFLGSIIPLLASAGFPTYENSGSWEEVTANRTSVMAIETALLSKIKTLTEKDSSFDFFKEGYGRDSFHETLDIMIDNGLHEIGRRLPHESPDYDPNSVKHREADAALAYVLMYDLPNLLSDAQVPIAIKRKVKKDAEHTGREVDLDEKQNLRGKFTPQGRPAAWTHPLGQLSSWAAKRSLQEADPKDAEHYSSLSSDFLNQVLSTVTGEDQWHATLNEDGEYHVRKVPAFKLPEVLSHTHQTAVY